MVWGKALCVVALVATCFACGANKPAQPPPGTHGPGDAPALTPPASPTQTASAGQRVVDRCTASSVRPGNAILVCEGFRLWVVQPMGEAPEIVLERIRRTHADGSPGAPTRHGTLRVSNEEFPATEYEGRAGERVVFGRIASADGTELVATCFARSEIFEQCLRALDEVARDGFPAYAKPLPEPTKIGERVLKTPQECTLVGNNRIRCPATEFHWGNADARMDKVIAENMQRGLERLGSVSHSRAACTLLDVGTDCHLFRVARPEGPMTVVIGVATTPVGMFFAQCNSFDTRLGLTPVPCDQVLAMGKN